MRRIVSKVIAMIAVLTALLPMAACDTVLQYPDGEGIDPTLVKVHFELSVDFSPINDPLIATYADSRLGDFDVRYQIAVYARSGAHAGEFVLRKAWTDDVIQSGPMTISTDVELHAEQYDVYGWIDFVPRGTAEDYYYVTDDLRKVYISDPNIGGLDTRDAFSGKAYVDLTPYRDVKFAEVTIPLPMERPFGKFKIQATDVQKFLESYKPRTTYADVLPSTCTVRYTCYFPTAYDQNTRRASAEEFSLDVNHTSDVTEIEGSSATLSSNYVFVCTDNTAVTADFEVYNSSGQLLASIRGVTIPIKRNRLTIVKGESVSMAALT